MLTYHRTSLLTSKAQTLVNTVNTHGVMGKGIAQEFKFRHPTMFEQYKRICDEGLLDVGKLCLWKGSSQWVLNFPTKRHWRYPSKLEYIEKGLVKFCAEYENRGIREIAFPRLGCGNGGLDWEEVRPLMENYLARLPISVYIHDHSVDTPLPEHLAPSSPEGSSQMIRFSAPLRTFPSPADDMPQRARLRLAVRRLRHAQARRRNAMLEFIKSPDDVLALKYSGSITGNDLDMALDKLEVLLAKPGKIHCYIEMVGIERFEFSALPHHVSRSFPLFGKLNRFGRVAVVADQAWLRVLTRLESAMLPNVSYRVYEPEERKAALDFAFGKELVTA